jgi:hypothetical protein
MRRQDENTMIVDIVSDVADDLGVRGGNVLYGLTVVWISLLVY